MRTEEGSIVSMGKTIGGIDRKPCVVVDPESSDSRDSVSSPKPSFQITTDVSNSGWGAHTDDGDTLSGSFSTRLVKEHINHKELLAVLFTLKEWGAYFKGKAVQFWLDNRTAVAYISKQGGTLSASMTQTAADIFCLCALYEIHISATYITGSLNVVAHTASRQGQF